MDDFDIQQLSRAIRLAMNGRGAVEPNPMVGCVIAEGGRVIAEGYHSEFGGPHAEAAALAAATGSVEWATVYVTLEPCCHSDKKTPPCAPRLIEAKVRRIVVGCVDPNPQVNGKGIEALRAAGIQVPVASGEIQAEAMQLIAPFIARTAYHRPYITLKWAQTKDGKVAGPLGKRLQISNAATTCAVHTLRSRCDAILVGVNTVLADDPLLTARDVARSRLQFRIILDSALRTPTNSRLALTSSEGLVDLHYTESGFVRATPERIKALMKSGINLYLAKENSEGTVSLPTLMKHESLGDVTNLLVEPGPTLARSFFDAGAADRVWVIRSPLALNEPKAPAAIEIPRRYVKTGEVELDGDVLTEYLDTESDVFFAPSPSADFVLTRESQ